MRGPSLIAALFLLSLWATLALGVQPVPLHSIWPALHAPDPANLAHVTLRDIRLPRLGIGLIAGAAFGVAGTLMQTLTRNPLADPGILGVNAGAAFAVVLGALLLGRADAMTTALLAIPGAAIAAACVFALGGGLSGEPGPIRLTLAGIALNAFLLSAVSALVTLRGDALEVFRYWVAGSLAQGAGKPMAALAALATIGWLLGLLLAPMLETLALGRNMARGLGTNPLTVQGGTLLAITLLTATGVAAAGPVAFLGLIVPPLARRLIGPNLRHMLLAAPFLGAAVILLADTAGRLLIAPAEIRVGIMTAIIGGPVFIWIARTLTARGER